jgi:hypothetical protein
MVESALTLHGQEVVDIQRGTVESVSPGKLIVLATKSGSTATATHIADTGHASNTITNR